MSATTSYTSMLDGMWAPEGSDINERLKRLQNLEKMRKEREAQRKAKFGDTEDGQRVAIVKTSCFRNANGSGQESAASIRRTLSMNEDSSYGGARPKLGSYKSSSDKVLGATDVDDIFGDIKAEIILQSRQPLRSDRQYESRTRYGSSDSDDSYAGSRYDFSRSTTYPSETGTSFSAKTEAIINKYANRRPYTSLRSHEESNEQNGYSGEYSTEQVIDSSETNTENVADHHDDHIEDDEEPKQFIERLKQGNHENGNSSRNLPGSQNSAFILNSMPTIPPYKQTEEDKPADLPELVHPTEDIVSVAQEISSTFGTTRTPGSTPRKTPARSQTNGKKSNKASVKRKSSKKMAPAVPPKPVKSPSPVVDNGGSTQLDSSVTYEIIEKEDSSGDERGKILPVRESFYNSRPSEWGVVPSPGRINQMHEFFAGEDASEQPLILRVLDGRGVREELDKSVSEIKEEKQEPVKTPVSARKSAEKDKLNGRRSKSPLDRLKNSVARNSESENESVNTSGSENEVKSNGVNGRKNSSANTNSSKENNSELSISDKLAKLESMTQEKKRKHSLTDKEDKKPVPSYMVGTSSSNQKRARNKDAPVASAASTPTRDLKKDVRELKQFVRENSVPSTPVDSPVKSLTDFYGTSKQAHISTKEMSVQTEFVIDFPDINYVCKHCGKSSFEEVQSPALTVENVNQSTKKTNGRKESKSESKFSSKDSVKSFGESSAKSDKTGRYIKKPATSSSHSYMKGTTSSRLKNTTPTEGDRLRKGSAPELVHETKGTSLRGTVSQRTKAFENASKSARAKSSERKNTANERSKLRKSKSVDHVSASANGLSLPPEDSTDLETTLTSSETIQAETTQKSNTKPNVTKNESTKEVSSVSASSVQPPKSPSVTRKLETSPMETPISPKKPPLASPRSDIPDDKDVSVESKGQFMSIGDNPFIKKDGTGRTRTQSRDKTGETVWEKAEGRSRDSSLKRSNSSSTGERPNSAASLRRHNTSAGEKSSVSELTWSDSGSTESLSRTSKSSWHGSSTSLNRDVERSPSRRPRSTSTSSNTSQNAMLNLLVPQASTRHPVSGAIETDVDAAYNDHLKDSKYERVHDEESVNRAHLEFAKNACHLLEFEIKKRDSSNESEKGNNKDNASDNKENDVDVNVVNGGVDYNQNSPGEMKPSKKEKSKKGLFKGKLFKK